MPTLKQKRAARLVVENLVADKPLTGAQIVANSGYGPSMSKNPQVILKSAGVNEELKNYGFDSDKAKEVVGEILIAGENDTVKLKAADTIFKVNGDYAPEKRLNINLDGELTEREQQVAQKLLQSQRD